LLFVSPTDTTLSACKIFYIALSLRIPLRICFLLARSIGKEFASSLGKPLANLINIFAQSLYRCHVCYATTRLKRNDTPSGHRLLRHSILSTGGSGDTAHQTLHGFAFFSSTLLGNLTDLLGDFLLSQTHHFLLALLRNGGLLLTRCHLHGTYSGFLLRLQLLESKQVDKLLRLLIPLHQSLRIPTVCVHPTRDFLVDHGMASPQGGLLRGPL
jgi:hypothetical protein